MRVPAPALLALVPRRSSFDFGCGSAALCLRALSEAGVSLSSQLGDRFHWKEDYFTTMGTLAEWLLNSGAYMHWMLARPDGYVPLCWTRTAYSKTYVPLGK